MTYELRFLPIALKEWEKLAPPIKAQFKKKLAERLVNPRVPADKLKGYDSVYKIKLRSLGYRLAYEVVDDALIVYVLAVGKRDKGKIYAVLKGRL
ncbi:type II toxin-antitoxin system RelE family toxin [Synechococcus elongatus]|uniref:Type II toxin-antitoxin system RelE/ParE family toxin n=1 Tax=Synechococcus elongatus PCC 11802 TaxID=2283154 RepID=A0AAT9JYP5_SYNEL|nr:type II toxin-antitoxin system RelE/ParE family toxin [Synechococcus elongatus]QFZ91497.1 type II toxin-antitoxin system RelE/ParE family toxin [Synechococcus elongatus PCC 11802]